MALRPKQYLTPDDPSNCPVAALKAFRDQRPASSMTIYSPFYNATNCNHKRLQGSFSRYKNPNLKRNYTSVNYEGYGRTCLFSWEEDKSFSTKNYMHQIASCWHCLYYNSTVDWAHKRPKRQKLRNCLG